MRLRDWRTKRGKTQAWLSRRTGISAVVLSRYENGGMPWLPNAIKISRATCGEVSVESWCSLDQIALPSLNGEPLASITNSQTESDEPLVADLSQQELTEHLKNRE